MKLAIVAIVVWAAVEGLSGLKAVQTVNHINDSRQAAIEQAINQ